MKVEVNIQPHGTYLLARYRGPDSLEISRSIMRQLVEACETHGCFRILMIAFLENPLSITENYDAYKMFVEVGFSSKHRMAWVDQNPDTLESTEFAETVLSNRGMMARLFKDVEEARRWLIDDIDASVGS